MKEFKDFTWDDLLSYNAWLVIQGITRGDDLKSVMYRVQTLTIQWEADRIAKEKTAKKAMKDGK